MALVRRPVFETEIRPAKRQQRKLRFQLSKARCRRSLWGLGNARFGFPRCRLHSNLVTSRLSGFGVALVRRPVFETEIRPVKRQQRNLRLQ